MICYYGLSLVNVLLKLKKIGILKMGISEVVIQGTKKMH